MSASTKTISLHLENNAQVIVHEQMGNVWANGLHDVVFATTARSVPRDQGKGEHWRLKVVSEFVTVCRITPLLLALRGSSLNFGVGICRKVWGSCLK